MEPIRVRVMNVTGKIRSDINERCKDDIEYRPIARDVDNAIDKVDRQCRIAESMSDEDARISILTRVDDILEEFRFAKSYDDVRKAMDCVYSIIT